MAYAVVAVKKGPTLESSLNCIFFINVNTFVLTRINVYRDFMHSTSNIVCGPLSPKITFMDSNTIANLFFRKALSSALNPKE